MPVALAPTSVGWSRPAPAPIGPISHLIAVQRSRVAQLEARLAANGHRYPARPSHIIRRNTWSDSPSGHVCHHSVTLWNRLDRQTGPREVRGRSCYPFGIGGTTLPTGSSRRSSEHSGLSRRRLRGRRRRAAVAADGVCQAWKSESPAGTVVPITDGTAPAGVSGPMSRCAGESSATLNITLCYKSS